MIQCSFVAAQIVIRVYFHSMGLPSQREGLLRGRLRMPSAVRRRSAYGAIEAPSRGRASAYSCPQLQTFMLGSATGR